MKTKLTVLKWSGFGWEKTTFEELPINKNITIKIVDSSTIIYNLIPMKEMK